MHMFLFRCVTYIWRTVNQKLWFIQNQHICKTESICYFFRWIIFIRCKNVPPTMTECRKEPSQSFNLKLNFWTRKKSNRRNLKWWSWNFNTFMTNVYHIQIDFVWTIFPGRWFIFCAVRFYCPSQNKNHNNKFTWAYTFLCFGCVYRHTSDLLPGIERIQKKMDSIKIHCVNRGLNMMDLLHIKTKLKTKTTIAKACTYWTQNPFFYWLMFEKQESHKMSKPKVGMGK